MLRASNRDLACYVSIVVMANSLVVSLYGDFPIQVKPLLNVTTNLFYFFKTGFKRLDHIRVEMTASIGFQKV